MIATLPDDKAAARKIATANRLKSHEKLKDLAPLKLVKTRFPAEATPGFNRVSAFYPYQSEIDTRPLLGKLAGDGWTTCLPVVIEMGLPLIFRRWLPGEPTIKGSLKIDCPALDSPEVEPDVLLVPLLAFDRNGYRLGYGGGFYDRTLDKLRGKKKIIAIGVGYSGQEVEQVPHSSHDQPLDYMLTEEELITCG